MVADRRHRSGLLSDCLHRGRYFCRHPIPVQGLEDPAAARSRAPLPGGTRPPRHATRNTHTPPTTTATPPTHPQQPSDFASIDGAITYAQQSGFTIINLFNEYAPLSKYGDAVGAEILYLAFSHIAELDKNASLTVTGSATEEALTLTISALTDRAPVLGARHMGEIRALATSVGGSVDTDTQAASWTLTARLPTTAGAPS